LISAGAADPGFNPAAWMVFASTMIFDK